MESLLSGVTRAHVDTDPFPAYGTITLTMRR